jgi:hypothetical protein
MSRTWILKGPHDRVDERGTREQREHRQRRHLAPVDGHDERFQVRDAGHRALERGAV